MEWFDQLLGKFRRFPAPVLVAHVASRFVFGFGLGAYLASHRDSRWKAVGCGAMIVGTALVLPSIARLLKDESWGQ